MRVKPINDSLPGERVVAVHPVMSPQTQSHWHRRLNLYTGRALSDLALTAEQEGRAGRLALGGQMLSPGVVSGLEVTVDSVNVVAFEKPQTTADAAKRLLTNLPRLDTNAIAKAVKAAKAPRSNRKAPVDSGVIKPAGVTGAKLDLAALRLRAAGTFYYNIAPGFGITASGEDVNLPTGLRIDVKSVPVYAPSQLLAQAEVLKANRETKVTEAAIAGPAEKTEPEATPSDRLLPRREGPPLQELIDARLEIPPAGILILQPIVAELIGEYDPEDPCEEDPRNYAFEDWRRVDGCRLLFYTWPQDWLPLPTRDQQWRNRIAYAIFNEERSNQPDELLPWEEVGVPIALVGFDAAWNVQFVDRHSVVRAGGRRKRRHMFIPKSGNRFLWQARLQQFAEQLTETDDDDKSAQILAAQFRYLPPAGVLPRKAVELKAGHVAESFVGRNNFFPTTYQVDATPIPIEQLDTAMADSASMSPFDTFAPDRVQVLVPVPQIWFEPDLLKAEVVSRKFDEEIQRLTALINDRLAHRFQVRQKHRALFSSIKGTPPQYVEPDPAVIAAVAPETDNFGTTVESDGFIAAGVVTVIPFDDLQRKLTAQVSSGIIDDRESRQLDPRGLENFIAYLQAKVDFVSDRVDFGFLRVQTDIYRMRQLILNNVAATRLATSPVLASIAKGDTAVATKTDIEKFLSIAKDKKVPPPTAKAPPPTADIGSISKSEALLRSAAPLKEEMAASFVSIDAPMTFAPLMTFMPEFKVVPAMTTVGQQLIEQKGPLIGEQLISRTVTIAERIEESKAAEAKSYCVSTKFDIVNGLVNMMTGDTGIKLDEINIPGVLKYEQVTVEGQRKEVPVFQGGMPVRETRKLGDIKNDLQRRILNETTNQELDEAKLFSIGVSLLEDTISVLRAVEAKIQAYKEIIELSRKKLIEAATFLAKAERRLAELEHDLAEARHDESVARALLVDEQNRVDAINQRRDRVIREQVRFLAYRRPRFVDLNVPAPVRNLDPGLVTSPVPACLGHDATMPSELRTTISLLRESPIKWFPKIHPLLARLDRIEMLQQTVQTAKQRASVHTVLGANEAPAAPTRAGIAIQQAYFAQQTIVTQYRARTAQFDLSILANQTWKLAHAQAKEIVSLGDLIEAAHGRADLAQQAARELEDISRIAGCLYTNFGSVLPELRLIWIEAFSQFDRPVDLRNLAVLPRWYDVNYLDRRELQSLVDWLYQQVDPLSPEATSLISDVIRICLLLAGHAPVNQIIAGHISKPTTVQTGGLVEMTVDYTKVRVGMSVLMYSALNEVLARGVVEDLGVGKAAARVVAVKQDMVQGATLESGARVQFAESRALEVNPQIFGKMMSGK